MDRGGAGGGQRGERLRKILAERQEAGEDGPLLARLKAKSDDTDVETKRAKIQERIAKLQERLDELDEEEAGDDT